MPPADVAEPTPEVPPADVPEPTPEVPPEDVPEPTPSAEIPPATDAVPTTDPAPSAAPVEDAPATPAPVDPDAVIVEVELPPDDSLEPDAAAPSLSDDAVADLAEVAESGAPRGGESDFAVQPGAGQHLAVTSAHGGHLVPSSSTIVTDVAINSAPVRPPTDPLLWRHRPPDRTLDLSAWSDEVGVPAAAEAVSGSIIALAAPRVPSAVSVAVDFGRAGHGWAGAIVFNLWLRRTLRQRRMSQRQLAHLAGIDHSTISRLVTGERTPSLATATKLAQALRMDPTETAASLGLLTQDRVMFPTQRVESALRGDDDLEEEDVHAIMDAYLIRRARRRRAREEARAPGDGAHPLAAQRDRPSRSG